MHPCRASLRSVQNASGPQRFCTQKQALNALAFFFKHVLGKEDPVFNVRLRKTGARVPVVLSQVETKRLLDTLEKPDSNPDRGSAKVAATASDAPKPKKHNPRYGLVARLQYGAGLRLSEVVRLRVKDIDLDRGTVTVRLGKGDKDCLGCRLPAPSPFGLPAAGCLAA